MLTLRTSPKAGERFDVMEYSLLKFFHLLGAILVGGGLIGVWIRRGSPSDLCTGVLRTHEGTLFDMTRQFLVDHIQRIIYGW